MSNTIVLMFNKEDKEEEEKEGRHPKRYLFTNQTLPDTRIEKPSLSIFSGAGKAFACRRRESDLSLPHCIRLLFFFSLLAKVFPLLELSRTLSNHMQQQTGDSPFSNKGQRASLATFISKSLLTSFSRNHLLAPTLPDPSNQRADLDSITMLFSRSGSLTLEEISSWTSLMAREFYLGPSDAPCRDEASTAHDDSFFSVTLIHNKTFTFSDSSASTPDHVHNRLLKNLLILELLPSPQIFSTPPISRHTLTESWSTKATLGFCLKGLEPNVGPLPLQQPKPISSDQSLNEIKPRSVSFCFLSTCSDRLGRFLILNGRRLHMREKSPLLLWFFNHTLRTLELVLSMAKSFESKSLKVYRLLFPTPSCWWDVCDHRFSMAESSSTTIYAKDLLNVNINKLWLLCFSPHCVFDQSSSDFEIVVNRSFAVAFICLQALLPVRHTSLAPSSTSLRLLTVTISPPIDPFVEVRSTNRDLTCAQPLFSLGLTALMEPMSICFSYLLVVLENAFLCNALIFGSFAPLLSMYLNLI